MYDMKRHDKKTRKEKQDAFCKDKFPKTGKSKICKVTKGEHVFNVPCKTTYGSGYEVECACGKRQWKLPALRSLKRLPTYMICTKHGFYETCGWRGKKDTGCWACDLGLEPFKDNI